MAAWRSRSRHLGVRNGRHIVLIGPLSHGCLLCVCPARIHKYLVHLELAPIPRSTLQPLLPSSIMADSGTSSQDEKASVVHDNSKPSRRSFFAKKLNTDEKDVEITANVEPAQISVLGLFRWVWSRMCRHVFLNFLDIPQSWKFSSMSLV